VQLVGEYNAIDAAGIGKNKKQKTKTVYNTLSPVWEQSFAFHVQEGEEDAVSVLVTLWDRNRTHADRFIGKVLVPLKTLCANSALHNSTGSGDTSNNGSSTSTKGRPGRITSTRTTSTKYRLVDSKWRDSKVGIVYIGLHI
jgi:Ca2+-dependent lipid-binding protein